MGKVIFLFLQVFCIFFTASCGFTPVYSTHNAQNVQTALNKIDVAIIPDKTGVDLRNALLDRLYSGTPASDPDYMLDVNLIREQIMDSGIARDATTTREQLTLTFHAVLTDKQSGDKIWKREFKAITNYNILASQYATLVAQQDARKRALNQVADDIITQLSLYFSRPDA